MLSRTYVWICYLYSSKILDGYGIKHQSLDSLNDDDWFSMEDNRDDILEDDASNNE